ncbi:MAG TPA: hypothetical protein VHE35_35080, partial [Kofleriaceae bacterium]|nr:hypothetical protein [Kofleriaceae bacterium]
MQRSRLVDPDPTMAPRREPSSRRLAAAGLVVSIALHVLGWGAIRAVRSPRARPAPTFTLIDLAPVVRPAEELPPEQELAATKPPAAAPEAGAAAATP